MANQTFQVWVSKYALTRGVFEVTVEDCSPPMVKTLDNYPSFYHGDDWHRTKAEAVVKAEKMRAAKIISVRRQLNKLEKMKFDPT